MTPSEHDWLLLQGLAQIPCALLVAIAGKPDVVIYARALEDIGALAALAGTQGPTTRSGTILPQRPATAFCHALSPWRCAHHTECPCPTGAGLMTKT